MALRVDYVARETATNLRRNVSMASAALVSVIVSLALVGGALLVKRGADRATIQWKGGVEISVFMKPDAAPSEIDGVRQELLANPEVKKVRYVDKHEAYGEFREMFSNQPDLTESVTEDNLPPSFRVVPKHAEEVDSIGDRFKDRAGVREVVYARDTVKALLSITNLVQFLLWAIAAGLLLAAALLILNTIRMAIFARRREVAVMKLVGATNWFIRVPFMLEGMVQGLIGAGLAWLLVWGGRTVIQDRIQHARNLDFFKQFFVTTSDVVGTGIFLVAVGVVLGTVGSAVAVSRFLDV